MSPRSREQTPPPDPSQAISDDRFNENRIGLDHVSFSVASMADLEGAVNILDAHGIEHGAIVSLEAAGIAILAIVIRTIFKLN